MEEERRKDMCKGSLISCFLAVVLLTCGLEGKVWSEPFLQASGTGVIGMAAEEEEGGESTTQEQRPEEIYPETGEYDEEDILEEEFPMDNRGREETLRKPSGEGAHEIKGDK